MDIMQLSVFDKTLQELNLWLKPIMGSLGATKRDTAWDALKARPHTLCDRMVRKRRAYRRAVADVDPRSPL